MNRVESSLPAKTKLDFLFVIDNSSSMCEEQANLTRNFKLFSDFLFDELQGAADYRIAVVSTDLGDAQRPNELAGQFLYQPASPTMAGSCYNATELPPTSDCGAPGSLAPVINPQGIEQSVDAALPREERTVALKAELERQFRCRATLGTQGSNFERGLEAMRLALSCQGPNSELFSECCVNYGQPNSYYNPACELSPGSAGPEFLRPDATLVVIFISDEDDCSTPSDNPNETSRLICRTGGTVDEDSDGVPDIYQDYCRGSVSAEECYQRECGPYVAEGSAKCREERCSISSTDISECLWYRSRLSPVSDFKIFLQNLKARPLDQLLVASLVGFRVYTELGNELTYNLRASDESCSGDAFEPTERCCPGGDCPSTRSIKMSCDFSDKGIRAAPGTRYLQLSEALGGNGLGCASGNEPLVDPVAQTLMRQPNVAPNECVNICEEDFITPLQSIKERVASLLTTYCVDRQPACLISTQADEAGESAPNRPCEGDELNDPNNYPLQVSMRCTSERCDEPLPLTTLSPDQWSLTLTGGACVVLNRLPPAGADVFLEFLVNTNNPNEMSPTAGSNTAGSNTAGSNTAGVSGAL